jgi:hypothetical protein
VRRIIGAVLIALLLIGMAVLGAWQLRGAGGGVARAVAWHCLEMHRRSGSARVSPPI